VESTGVSAEFGVARRTIVMAFPRILLAVPLLVAGMYLPAAGAEPPKPPAGDLGMVHEAFSVKEVNVTCGKTLTMVNNSRWLHILGPGREGALIADKNVPVGTRQLVQTNGTYTTGAWNTPGTYYLTCSIHPEMNVKVVVTDCCCPHGT
jgi:plastocyanin